MILAIVFWLAAVFALQQAHKRGWLHSPWHLDLAQLGLLGLATLGFFWRVAAEQNWMPADGGDLVSFLFPSYRFAAESLHAGAWPLWNPHIYGGAPHVGDIQAGFLYPPNLILFALRPEFAYLDLQWMSMLHIWFAGAGMYLLLARGMRLGRVSALAGAIAFMFSDGFLVHFGNLNLNATMAWLPWVFWPLLRALQAMTTEGRLLGSLCAGALLGIAILAGHIQAALYIGMALVFYVAFWLFQRRADPDFRRCITSGVGALLICFMLAFLIAAPILLPALQLASFSEREAWNYTETAGYSLSPAQWIGWLIPGFFGRGPQFHWGAWPRVEVGYLGILTLVLAVLAIMLRRDRRTWLWAVLAVASFIISLGIYAILHGWLTLLPGFSLLRAPARFIFVTDFAVAVLAAIGLDAVLQPLTEDGRRRFDGLWRVTGYGAAAVFAVAIPLAYLGLLLVQDRDPAIVSRTSVALIAVMIFSGLLLASFVWLSARRSQWATSLTLGWLAVALIYLDLAGVGAYQDLGNADPSLAFDRPALIGFLEAQPGPARIDSRTDIESLWQPNTALLYGLEDVGGVANPSSLADVARYWEGLGSRSSRLYDLLNTRYLIARKDVELDWKKFALAFDTDPDLNAYENRAALPRAFFVTRVVSVSDHEAAWSAIQEPTFDPETTAIVEGTALPEASPARVTGIQLAPNRVRVEVTADGPAFLVLSQYWYPGWRAYVDGVAQGDPYRTDYVFQGVSVPAGTHSVELRFAPPLWRFGWLLAGVGWLLFGLGVAYALLRRRRDSTRLAPQPHFR